MTAELVYESMSICGIISMPWKNNVLNGEVNESDRKGERSILYCKTVSTIVDLHGQHLHAGLELCSW